MKEINKGDIVLTFVTSSFNSSQYSSVLKKKYILGRNLIFSFRNNSVEYYFLHKYRLAIPSKWYST